MFVSGLCPFTPDRLLRYALEAYPMSNKVPRLSAGKKLFCIRRCNVKLPSFVNGNVSWWSATLDGVTDSWGVQVSCKRSWRGRSGKGFFFFCLRSSPTGWDGTTGQAGCRNYLHDTLNSVRLFRRCLGGLRLNLIAARDTTEHLSNALQESYGQHLFFHLPFLFGGKIGRFRPLSIKS